MRAVRWTFAHPRAWAVTIGVAAAYTLAYLLVAKALIVDPAAGFARWGPLPNWIVAPTLSLRALTDWLNPPFVLYLTDAIALAPPLPTLLTALVLGALIGTNFAVATETMIRGPEACGARRPWWALGALPSFLASFSCCAPTVLLLLGANFAVAIIAIVPFVVPLAATVLVASLLWNLRRLQLATASARSLAAAPAA